MILRLRQGCYYSLRHHGQGDIITMLSLNHHCNHHCTIAVTITVPSLRCRSGGLNGRRNVSIWSLNSTDPAAVPVSLMSVNHGLGGGYSSFDTSGGKVRLLYENGPPHVYDYSIWIAHIGKAA